MNNHGKRCDCDECFVRRRHDKIAGSEWFAEVDDVNNVAGEELRSCLIEDPLMDEEEIRERIAEAQVRQ